MWLLTCVKDKEDRINLLTGKEYSVGRKPDDCDIAVLNDQSVSRKHAVLTVSHSEANLPHPHKPSILTIKDLSKFGTYVNNTRLRKDHPQILKSGDSIKFGSLQSVYEVKHQPLLLSTSCLDAGSKKTVKSVACKLGAHVLNDWRRGCTLLIMNHLSVTIKVICALVSRCPVVTPQYLVHYQASMESKSKPPDVEQYQPPLAESKLDPKEISFKPREQRSTLFQGMKFIFLSPKQFKKLCLAVELAGGVPVLMEEGSDENNDRVLVEAGTCVMYTDHTDRAMVASQNARDWVCHVLKYLTEHNKRCIQDAELGYAVLYCSTDVYCNPDGEPGPHLYQSSEGMTSQTPALLMGVSQSTQATRVDKTILAQDTESQWTQDTMNMSGRRSMNATTTVVANSVLECSKANTTKQASFLLKDIKEEPASPMPPNNNRKRQREEPTVSEPPCKRPLPTATVSKPVKEELNRSGIDVDIPTATASRTRNGAADQAKSTHDKTEKESGQSNGGKRKPVGNTNGDGDRNGAVDILDTEEDTNTVREIPVVRSDKNNVHAHANAGGDTGTPIGSDDDDDEDFMRDVERLESQASLANGDGVPIEDGFLNCQNKPQVKIEKQDPDDVVTERLVVTETVSLLRKTPAPKRRNTELANQNGVSVWNGKPVKNFKKFKKVMNTGGNGLPNIIGGTDLVYYSNTTANNDVDLGFSQNINVDISQSSTASSRPSRRDDDLFD